MTILRSQWRRTERSNACEPRKPALSLENAMAIYSDRGNETVKRASKYAGALSEAIGTICLKPIYPTAKKSSPKPAIARALIKQCRAGPSNNSRFLIVDCRATIEMKSHEL